MLKGNIFCLNENKTFNLYRLFSVIYSSSCAQYALTIEVTHLRNDKGSILLVLCNEDQKKAKDVKGTIDKAKCVIYINRLTPVK